METAGENKVQGCADSSLCLDAMLPLDGVCIYAYSSTLPVVLTATYDEHFFRVPKQTNTLPGYVQ